MPLNCFVRQGETVQTFEHIENKLWRTFSYPIYYNSLAFVSHVKPFRWACQLQNQYSTVSRTMLVRKLSPPKLDRRGGIFPFPGLRADRRSSGASATACGSRFRPSRNTSEVSSERLPADAGRIADVLLKIPKPTHNIEPYLPDIPCRDAGLQQLTLRHLKHTTRFGY